MAADLDPSVALVAEQFAHACDLLRGDTTRQAERIHGLEEKAKDFETHIRSLTETATQYKLIASLATGGGVLGLISLLRTLIK